MNDLASGVTAWLLTYLAHSTLLLAAAWGIDAACRGRVPAVREFVWRAALVGALATATAYSCGWTARSAASLLQPAAAPHLRTAPPRAASPRAAHVADASRAARATPLAPAATPVPTPRGIPRGLARAAEALALLWLAGAAVGLTRHAHSARAARRLLAERRTVDAGIAAEFASMCAVQGLRPRGLSVSRAVGSPLTLPNGEIVLPEWAAGDLDARQRRALLAHELAHRARRDPQWHVLVQLLAAAMWLQPLLHLARRRLAALAELEADAWAARATRDPRALAECLATCAAHLTRTRTAAIGVAMASDGPLVARVDHLLTETIMSSRTVSWPLRLGVFLGLAGAAFVLPGCNAEDLITRTHGSSTRITTSQDGWGMSASVTRPGYTAKLRTTGVVRFADDESDVASLSPGGAFFLREKQGGVEHEYQVRPARGGDVSRLYSVNGHTAPLDAEGRAWLAAALPRIFRETAFDANGRVGRLLARGGPPRVLDECALITGDGGRAAYLTALFAQATLDAPQFSRALALASEMHSDYDVRCVLTAAMDDDPLDASRAGQVIAGAQSIGSDFELAEILRHAARLRAVHTEADAQAAWMGQAARLGSSYELRRTIQEGLEGGTGGAPFAASLVRLAGERITSDFELRTVIEVAAPRASDPAVAGACLTAMRGLHSDFERRTALVALASNAPLAPPSLGEALEVADGIGSQYEKRVALQVLARRIARDAALSARYRAAARTLGSYERGEALKALDDALAL